MTEVVIIAVVAVISIAVLAAAAISWAHKHAAQAAAISAKADQAAQFVSKEATKL